mgnify:CR=1 FL=1
MTGRQPCASAPACYNLLSIKDRGGPILPDNEKQRYCFQAMPSGKLQHLALVNILITPCLSFSMLPPPSFISLIAFFNDGGTLVIPCCPILSIGISVTSFVPTLFNSFPTHHALIFMRKEKRENVWVRNESHCD